MIGKTRITPWRNTPPFLLALFVFLLPGRVLFAAKSLALPAKTWGVCFGNSPRFNGLRFNVTDEKLDLVNGVNITLWKANDKKASGTVNGLSLGLIPYAGELNGIQIGLLGPGAKETMRGINLGLIGAGSGSDMVGLGVGAGKNVIGITIASLGAGAGDRMAGLTVCGLGAGAPVLEGLTVAGIGLGGKRISGVSLALGSIQIVENGTYSGLAVSAFNHIKGTMKGVAIGIVNYAYRLKGLQIGLVNIVRDNPKGRGILPIINFNF
jgi:hypothetical protein